MASRGGSPARHVKGAAVSAENHSEDSGHGPWRDNAPRAVCARLEGILAPAGLAALALPPLGGGTATEARPAAVLVDRDLSAAAKRTAFGLAAERLRAAGGGWAWLREVVDD